MSGNDPSQYSWVFHKLVTSESDIVGAIAYSIYKTRKIEYIREFNEENSHEPSPQELAEFNRTAKLPGQLDDYRDKAERYLDEFCEAVLAERIRVAEQELLKSTFLKAVTPTWWKGVRDNVIAGLVTTVLALGLLLIMWMQAVGPDKMFSDVMRHYLPTPTQNPTEK